MWVIGQMSLQIYAFCLKKNEAICLMPILTKIPGVNLAHFRAKLYEAMVKWAAPGFLWHYRMLNGPALKFKRN
jgi:hypothetical protein